MLLVDFMIMRQASCDLIVAMMIKTFESPSDQRVEIFSVNQWSQFIQLAGGLIVISIDDLNLELDF